MVAAATHGQEEPDHDDGRGHTAEAAQYTGWLQRQDNAERQGHDEERGKGVGLPEGGEDPVLVEDVPQRVGSDVLEQPVAGGDRPGDHDGQRQRRPIGNKPDQAVPERVEQDGGQPLVLEGLAVQADAPDLRRRVRKQVPQHIRPDEHVGHHADGRHRTAAPHPQSGEASERDRGDREHLVLRAGKSVELPLAEHDHDQDHGQTETPGEPRAEAVGVGDPRR